LQHQLDELEKAIPALEKKKLELETQLASGITDYNEIQKLGEALKAVSEDLDEKSLRWLEIQEEM